MTGLVIGAGKWNIFDMAKSIFSDLGDLSHYGILILGVALLFFGAWQGFKAVTAQNGRGKHVVTAIAAFAVGAFFTVGGFKNIYTASQGVSETMDNWGQGKTDGGNEAGLRK